MQYVFLAFVLSVVATYIGMRMYPHHIKPVEALIVVATSTLLLCAVYYAVHYQQGKDYQILNGEVTKKYSEKVSCSHSHQVCSGSGKTRSCTTYYEHAYDVDWVVESSVGSIRIDRVNRQGTEEPPRWTQVDIGEPFAMEDTYFNYVKAAPFSIFNRASMESTLPIPAYPEVYDYYRINRVKVFGAPVGEMGILNQALNYKLKKLGPQKKVNVVVVLHGKDDKYAEVLKAKMLGGKINDVVVALGVNPDQTFKNVSVFSWSKSDLVNTRLRDRLLDIGKLDQTAVANAIAETIQTNYTHRSIKEFEYLDNDVQFSVGMTILLLVCCALFPVLGCWIAYHVD